jgi:hypothetical protein
MDVAHLARIVTDAGVERRAGAFFYNVVGAGSQLNTLSTQYEGVRAGTSRVCSADILADRDNRRRAEMTYKGAIPESGAELQLATSSMSAHGTADRTRACRCRPDRLHKRYDSVYIWSWARQLTCADKFLRSAA